MTKTSKMNATMRARVQALSPEIAAHVATMLMKKHPEIDLAKPLDEALDALGITPTDVVMVLASDSSPEGTIAMETLMGKSIDKVGKKDPDLPPDVKDAPAPASRRPARQPRAPRTDRPARVGKTDPRIISYVMPNPKKVGSLSAARYEHYRVGARVDEVVAKDKLRWDDLAWDLERGHVQIVSPEEWAAMNVPAPSETEAA